MEYNCMKCGRSFICEDTISFCPFCGQAYKSESVASSVPVQKIIIASDSERSIQEKYWKMTQASISAALRRLWHETPRFVPEREEDEDEIKTPEKYKIIPLNIRDFVSLKQCTSMASFRKKLEEYVSALAQSCGVHAGVLSVAKDNQEQFRKALIARRLSYELGEWSAEDLEDESAVNVDRERRYIDDYCHDLAEALGSSVPDRLRPDLQYDPDNVNWLEIMENDEDLDKLPEITPDHLALLNAIKETLPALLKVVAENSLFAVSTISGETDKQFKPAETAEALRELSALDYDPIFGEAPERFIEAFSRAVSNMTQFFNQLPDYEDVIDTTPDRQLERLKRKLDSVKMDALNNLIDRWSESLQQELDRLYQSQQENMIDVYNAVEEIREAHQVE